MAGKKMSDEHRQKISAALKGKRPKNLGDLHAASRGKPRPEVRGKNNGTWKGEEAVYGSKHAWVRRTFGTPGKCELCGTESAAKYEWHNLSGEYRRERKDWQRLCIPCHRKLTFAKAKQRGYVPWSKGMKGVTLNTGRTHIKPGQHLGTETEFKPGLVPHNKYLEPRLCNQCGQEYQPREANRKFCSYRCYWDSLKKPKP